jgi:hypothetical protein
MARVYGRKIIQIIFILITINFYKIMLSHAQKYSVFLFKTSLFTKIPRLPYLLLNRVFKENLIFNLMKNNKNGKTKGKVSK